ncbi:MAG: agmatinase family protein [Planctomycetes bacterium]|nr:agmatinase family protein [Planctomycetota bacterium]
MAPFDPNAAAAPDSGIFGLSCPEQDAAIVLMPVPFAATVSYGGGAERGPEAILAGSRQVDLFDVQFGRIYERGIHLLAADPAILPSHARARAQAAALIERGGATPADAAAVAAIDAAGAHVNDLVHATTRRLLAAGRIPGILGGDHSVPFGAIRACAERHPGLGILHVDAHADLRVAYEGFRWSHASIMDNVLREVPGVARLVQVGIRDLCEQEHDAVQRSAGRVVTHYDLEWQRRRFEGATFDALCREAIDALPRDVYVSFDIDGLDPALCPHTGTPVPGGMSFAEVAHLLRTLVERGRRVVGFDLVEVAPGADEWDANVGARVLYKLCGAALHSAT